MLVLGRRPGESFFIGDDIEIVILESYSQVRIGIRAPRDVEVLRTELIAAGRLPVRDKAGGSGAPVASSS